MSDIEVFDASAVRAHRQRAAALLPDVAPVLDDLAARLLDRLDDTTHRFTHALVQSAIYGSLPIERRVVLHRQTAAGRCR